jgi:hypothetical protein
MGLKTREGWSRMDRMITEHGEEGALALIMTRVSEGEDPRDIARGNGMPWMVMRRWLEDKAERMAEWELAKRCFADGLVYEGLQVVRDASVESVPLARLQNESYVKAAAKMSRVEWGDREERGMSAGGGGITIIIGSVKPPAMEDHSGVTIEQKVSENSQLQSV